MSNSVPGRAPNNAPLGAEWALSPELTRWLGEVGLPAGSIRLPMPVTVTPMRS